VVSCFSRPYGEVGGRLGVRVVLYGGRRLGGFVMGMVIWVMVGSVIV